MMSSMSEKISKHDLYSDSDNESEYSMDGYDPNYIPEPQYEAFPPYKDKPVRKKREPRMLNKLNYYALFEAVPDDEWFCEFPHCSKTFLPYVMWGSRHHCRACGMTVCAEHSTPNITLSSQIVPQYVGDLAEVTTPILATSMDPSLLPAKVTLKYACLICCNRALPVKGRKGAETDETAGLSPGSLRRSERATKDVQQLLTTLSEVRGELQARVTDVCTLSGEMSQYATKTATMQRVIENLEQQLEIAQNEGHLSKAGKQRLRQLKSELKILEGLPSGSRGKTSMSTRSGGKLSGDETSSEGESRASSRSHSMSLDGVNDAGHPAPAVSAKKPVDKFYQDIVSRACGVLPSSAAQEGTKGEVSVAPLQGGTLVGVGSPAVVQDNQGDSSVDQGKGRESPAGGGSSQLGPLPSSQTYPTLATIYLALGTEAERTPPATPLQVQMQMQEVPSRRSPVMSESPIRRAEESPYRSRSAEFSYGDVYEAGVVVSSQQVEEGDASESVKIDTNESARASYSGQGASPLRTPPASAVSSDMLFQRSMSAIVNYHDVYASDEDEFDEGEEVLRFDTVAVPLNLGYPATSAAAGSRSQSASKNADGEGDGSIAEVYSNHSSVFNLLDRGFSGLSSTESFYMEPALPAGQMRVSIDTNETSETVETLDDLTYSTKNTPLKPETTVGTASSGPARGGAAGSAANGAGGNPLRLKRKSV